MNSSTIPVFSVENNLEGQLPRELAALEQLEIIDYGRNVDISGPIPTELGTIETLRELSLSGNALTGTLPDALCGAMLLEVLDVMSNVMGGTVPSCLASLPELSTLMLDDNMFDGQIPPDFGLMSKLGEFWVKKCLNRLGIFIQQVRLTQRYLDCRVSYLERK